MFVLKLSGTGIQNIINDLKMKNNIKYITIKALLKLNSKYYFC